MTIYNKGALAVDQCAHRLMETWGNPNFIPGLQEEQYSAFYHEDGLYSVWDSKRKICALVYARNPNAAIDKVKRTAMPNA